MRISSSSSSNSASRLGRSLWRLLFVDPGDQVGGEVDDLLQLLGLQLLTGLDAGQQIGQPGAGAAQVPDVHDGRGQLDVAHALATDLRARDLHAAALADDALEADALVLAAVALPVLGRAEDLLAEESVLLRLQRAVVDGFRLLDLAVRPLADSSAVARPIRSWSKLFTSSIQYAPNYSGRSRRRSSSVVRATLGPADVDAELLGGAVHVLVELAHLDLGRPLR